MEIMVFGLHSWEEEHLGIGDIVSIRSLALFLLDKMVISIEPLPSRSF